MKTLNEWLSEKGHKTMAANNLGCETMYDESLVQAQVADWITKLVGLCSNVPSNKKKAFTEAIVKEIKSRMVKG